MSKTKKSITNECRTCFNAAKGWHSLTAKTRDYKKRLKSYGELLQDITNINTGDYKSMDLPQFICGNCSHRLKSAHSFVQQAAEVNEKLCAMLNENVECLQEIQIDIETSREIKVEPVLCKENFECLEETPIDLEESCIEIKVEKEAEEKLKQSQYVEESGAEMKIEENKVQELEQCNLMLVEKSIRKDEKKSQRNTNPQNKIDSEFKIQGTTNETNKTEDDNSDSESITSDGSNWEEGKNLIKTSQEQISTNKSEVYTDVAVPCNKCHKIFKNSKLLAVHQRISHIPEEKKCICNLCGNKFTRYCNMYKHMRTFHGPETVTLISKRPEEDYIYKCDKCPKKYSRKKSLIYHTKLKHTLKEVVAVNESKTANNKVSKSADRGSLCPICGSSFTSRNQLTVHLRRHTGERPFKCDLCERAFLLVTQLNSHKRLHTGEKPYKCQVCEKAFRVSDDLRQHLRTHTNVRPHKCLQCERSFKHTQDLKIHLRSHTGERPYICGVCGDSFQRYNTLRAHRLRMGHVENLVNKDKLL